MFLLFDDWLIERDCDFLTLKEDANCPNRWKIKNTNDRTNWLNLQVWITNIQIDEATITRVKQWINSVIEMIIVIAKSYQTISILDVHLIELFINDSQVLSQHHIVNLKKKNRKG